MGQPGKRAPTVEICESDLPFEPLAMRQHALGPYPVDPNLLAQGIPPDDRVTFQDNIFGPLEGTPMPPPVPAGVAPAPAGAPPVPAGVAPPAPGPGVVTPSSAVGGGPGPSAAIATYDPQTGKFATPDGGVYQQTDVVEAPTSWQDLLPTS